MSARPACYIAIMVAIMAITNAIAISRTQRSFPNSAMVMFASICRGASR